MIFRDIDDIKKLTQMEKEDGKNRYTTEKILQFIEKNGINLLIINSENQKTAGFELLEAIYPEYQTDEKILEALFEVGGKKLFEEIDIHTGLLDKEDTKLKVYYGAIKGANRRIEQLDRRIDEEKIKKAQPERIEELEIQLEQEEIWKNDLITQKREIVASVIERQENNQKENSVAEVEEEKYDEEGYDKNGYDKEGFDRKGFDMRGKHRETGTRYDPEGYNYSGFDKFGLDKDGYDEFGQDAMGYDRDGYSYFGYDKNGYNKEGKYDPVHDTTKRKRKEEELEGLIKKKKTIDEILLEFEEAKKMEEDVK